jgi:hydrogenase maturation protein HypF
MKDEKEGISDLCQYILTHNRPIHTRADDSVMKLVGTKPLFIRRARGYVPYPQRIPQSLEADAHILALGGELKDTITLYKNGYAVTSQFLGDLDEYQNFSYFEETISHLTRLFSIKPDLVVSDLHPDFHTSRYAQKTGLPHLKVQHHFAHVLAPLMEHNYPLHKKVLGVSFDGFGLGEDGGAWGGEFLICDYGSYYRFGHLRNIPLPGGDLAAKQPWRMALSYLYDTYGENIPQTGIFKGVPENKIRGVLEMIKKQVNSPPTSSCGRLFDAVSFLTGCAPAEVEFEAEAPMRFESAIRTKTAKQYPFHIEEKDSPIQISFQKTIRAVLKDIEDQKTLSEMSAKFHNTLAKAVCATAELAKKRHGINTVVCVGGVFLNRELLLRTEKKLKERNFDFIRPILYSPNDESLSLGQLAYALYYLKKQQKR